MPLSAWVPKGRMRLRYWLAPASLAAASVAAVVLWAYLDRRHTEQSFAVVSKYCTDCHNPADLAGELSLQGLTPGDIPAHADKFEAAIVKLRGRLMPPPGNPQPTAQEVDNL